MVSGLFEKKQDAVQPHSAPPEALVVDDIIMPREEMDFSILVFVI
jgi:hypothetical protein